MTDPTRKVSLDVTDSQYEAITLPVDNKKILKIIAGPGAGKTRTLVSRIAYSLSQGVKPQSILALSLTNRAVFALRDQLTHMVGPDLASQVNIQTFHSYALSVVTSYYTSNWILLEDMGWKTLIKIVCNPKSTTGQKSRRLTKRDVEQIVDLANTNMSTAEISQRIHNKASAEDIESIVGWVRHTGVVTYKDVLKTAIRELKKSPELAGHFDTIIVDEFQDMYGDLLEIVKILTSNKSLIIAGDPNQSIYGFLGSDPQIMYTFGEKFKDKKIVVVTLRECFRSTPEIIAAADAVTQSSVPRIHIKPPGHKPILKTFNSDTEEFAFVVSEVRRILDSAEGLVKPGDIAVIGRTNRKVDTVREYLEGEGIDCVKLASTQPWIDSSLYHFIDYLYILRDADRADQSLISALSLVDKVGRTTLKGLMKDVADINQRLPAIEQLSLWGHLNTVTQESSRYRTLFGPFLKAVSSQKELFDRDPENPENIIRVLLSMSELGLKKSIMKTMRSPRDSEKYETLLNKFYETLCFSSTSKPVDTTLVDHFLKHYSHVPILERDDAVNISTIHAAKGLEFPITFILAKEYFGGFNENPAEERRSLYVAITRASALMYLNKMNEFSYVNAGSQEIKGINSHFTTNTPSFGKDFWANYAKGLGRMPNSTRQIHTYNRRAVHQCWHRMYFTKLLQKSSVIYRHLAVIK